MRRTQRPACKVAVGTEADSGIGQGIAIRLAAEGHPQDVASLIAFLASNEAGYSTGSTYVVDGGLMRNHHEQ
jgi:NAD(P)-dependent dehydrogenase (short-subunit alcohol dehydrogenase family)